MEFCDCPGAPKQVWRMGQEYWACSVCGMPVDPERPAIATRYPVGGMIAVVEPEGFFSYTTGTYVKNRRDFNDQLSRIKDPELNENHWARETPKHRRDYVEECIEKGIVP